MLRSKILYKESGDITSISMGFGQKIVIGSESFAGDYYISIPSSAEHALLRALVQDQKTKFKLYSYLIPKYQIFQLIEKKFRRATDDPFVDILDFLKKEEIEFTSDYWPNR